MSSIDSTPNSDAADLNGGDKGSGILGISSGDAAPSLQVKERIFHQVTQFVKVTVVVTLGIPVLPGRDDSFDARSLCEGDDPVGVIPPISEQVLCGKAFYQLSCNRAIRCGTRCNKESYWHTMRIHGQMYPSVEPPLVRSMS